MKSILATAFVLLQFFASAQLKYQKENRSIIFFAANGERFRITPYGNYMIRVQAVRRGEDFLPDDHYDMVESHNWPGQLNIRESGSTYQLSTANNGITMNVDKASLKLTFYQNGNAMSFLEVEKIEWQGDSICTRLRYDPEEHFTGLGHGYYGKEESIDLRGKIIHRNYGSEHGQQAPLIVPYYLSSKGYGVFLNSTFPNEFRLGTDNSYQFSIYGKARMDFFAIAGPQFATIMDRYTQLTGRPRLPLKAFFGLALSDKGNDHTATDPSDENWWKRKIGEHRNAGFPIDHIINDNRWRAGGGQRCESYFAWDSTRYPDPHEYEEWIKKNGLITTIDFNRCIAVKSEGWKTSFNIPQPEGIEFNTSAPDFTKKEVREWFWKLMWKKSLDPKLGYPGDALWIDEFDEMGRAPLQMHLGDGSLWMEKKNYWFFLIAKSLVQEGWDRYFKGSKRPFVWVRGMTAGAQRYATLWSGDIESNYNDMKTQVRGQQLAGLSGFPFWGHDAGGFRSDDPSHLPDDTIYRQWSMAFGSFTPFWKPHGIGRSRWPMDRSAEVQKDAKTYSDLRYRLMSYTYTYAHVASETGTPMARAMVFDYPREPLAWKADLQYMWGDEILVAPNCSGMATTVSVWLPGGQWFDFWNDEKISGNRTIDYYAELGKLPLFVKAGSIIPMNNFALSTAFIPSDTMTLQVYTGADGKFTLYEDDGISESYKKGAKRTTAIRFNEALFSLTIDPAKGSYKNAPGDKVYSIQFHGLSRPVCLKANGEELELVKHSQPGAGKAVWDEQRKILTLYLKMLPVSKPLHIIKEPVCS